MAVVSCGFVLMSCQVDLRLGFNASIERHSRS